MLQCMEAHDQNSDVDRVNELIKVVFYSFISNKSRLMVKQKCLIKYHSFTGQYATQQNCI